MKVSKLIFLLMAMLALPSCIPTGGGEGELEVAESIVASDEDIAGTLIGPGGASSFEAFKATVYPLVRSKTCVGCHDSGQSPQFAEEDPVKAYNNLVSTGKVNLANPGSSRIVVKIENQSHNCWSNNCGNDSNEMLVQVQRWADMIKDSDEIVNSGAQFLTTDLGFPSSYLPAQTEYGLTIIDAEQDDPTVQHGRFKTKIGNGAVNGKLIDTAYAIPNPLSDVPRELTLHVDLKGGNCETFEMNEINDPKNGPVRINEGEVHVNSGSRIGSNSLPIRDGYRFYRMLALGNMIRPDMRVEYGKKLLSGNYAQVSEMFLNTNTSNNQSNFEDYTREDGADFPIMIGPAVAVRLFYTAPYFTRYEEIFDNNGNLKSAGNTFTDLWQEQKNVYELFKGGSFDANNDLIRRKLEQDVSVDRKMLGYYRLKKAIDTNLSSTYTTSSTNPMFTVYQNNKEAFFQLSSEVKLRCKYAPSEANNYIWPGCDNNPQGSSQCPNYQFYKGKRTCGPTARRDNFEWYIASSEGEALTYGNARDKLTIDNNDNIIPATSGDIAAGNFFERIDLYFYTVIDTSTILTGNSGNSTANFSISQMVSTSPNNYVNNEGFTTASTQNFDFYDGAADTYNLDLSNILKGSEESVSPSVELQTFESTLFAEIRSQNCVNCHGVGQNPTFAVSEAATALQIIKSNNLVNFTNPSASFRPGEMVHNTGGADPSAVRTAFINAINSWKAQMDATVNGDDFGPMEDRERIPGYANYKVKIRDGEAGYYNVWLRTKKSGSVTNARVYFQLKNSSGNILQIKNNVSNNNGGNNVGNCISHAFSNEQFRWQTFGRDQELAAIDSFTGRRLLNNDQNPIPIGDERQYYYLTPGEYTLSIYEGSSGAGIDAIAFNRVFGSNADIDQASSSNSMTEKNVDELLEFQPDLIERHSKHVHDYHRYVLKYDISELLQLTGGDKAYFEVEVKEKFSSNVYEFRSPRINYPNGAGKGKSVRAKNIFLYINGQTAQTDKTFEKIDGYYGDNRVITYAPLVALKEGNSSTDTFAFGFEELSLSDYSNLSEIKPAGDLPEGPAMRQCRELALFTNTVKPIITNVTVTLNNSQNGLENSLNGSWPGNPQQRNVNLDVYMCRGCHTAEHPYFKMASYEANDNSLCEQMLSRVNFNNYYASQILKGIDTAGPHPKFSFLEELFWADSSKLRYKIHDQGNDYIKGYILKDTANGFASKIINRGFEIYRPEDFGMTLNTDYFSLSDNDKAKARLIGQIKRPRFINLPQVNSQQDNENNYNGYFIEEEHGQFDGTTRGENDFVGSNISPDPGVHGDPVNPDLFPIKTNRGGGSAGRAVYYHFNEPAYLNDPIGTMPPSFATGNGVSNMQVSWRYQKSGFGGESRRLSSIDYDGNGSYENNKNLFYEDEARINEKAREAIYNWIVKEHAACQAANDC
ncbi:hypothetical protein N9N67_02180 [Bacteriovoracaceae bacterium]|nr:hypothetical protein [Bacteriovoracaceae bacterium]